MTLSKLKSGISKSHVSIAIIMVIMVIMVMVSNNLNWSRDFWKNLVKYDSRGYYAFLPAVFIYNDLNFGFYDELDGKKYVEEREPFDYRTEVDGKKIDRYYCGTAITQMPFFLIAHAVAPWLGYDADGYTKPYIISISIAALFYLMIGLFYLNAILDLYKIIEWNKSLVLFATVFGTHLFYYAIVEPGMSHVYSFPLIAAFIYYGHKYFNSFHKKYPPLLALLLGLIILIRPSNGLALLILPFLAGNWSNLKNGVLQLFTSKRILLYTLIGFFAILSIQPIIYKIAIDHFFIYSYGGESFDFLSPHVLDILFSYRKGLFVYTPMLFIALTGCYFLYRSAPFKFYSWLGFFLILTYVLSCWWIWFYGGSFSSRVYVEYIPLFMILLALTLEQIKKKLLKSTYIAAIFILIAVCQIQTYQYRYTIIHWSEMNKEKYWDVFLRVDKLM